jgi:uncharacterized membrane protein
MNAEHIGLWRFAVGLVFLYLGIVNVRQTWRQRSICPSSLYIMGTAVSITWIAAFLAFTYKAISTAAGHHASHTW